MAATMELNAERRRKRWRRRAMIRQEFGGSMADPHQVISIMATAICDVRKDHPDDRMDPEEAKQIAKCIVEALTDAGLQIVPISKN
jgi:hypothetical protein